MESMIYKLRWGDMVVYVPGEGELVEEAIVSYQDRRGYVDLTVCKTAQRVIDVPPFITRVEELSQYLKSQAMGKMERGDYYYTLAQWQENIRSIPSVSSRAGRQ